MTPKEVLEKAVSTWNAKDEQGFTSLASTDIRIVGSGGLELQGLGGMRQFYQLWRGAFSDNVIRYHNVVDSAEQVIGEATFTGTHTETLAAPTGEIPPTNRRVSVDYVGALNVSGGKITSMRIYFDVLDLMAQLGLVGAPATA